MRLQRKILNICSRNIGHKLLFFVRFRLDSAKTLGEALEILTADIRYLTLTYLLWSSGHPKVSIHEGPNPRTSKTNTCPA